MNKHSKLTHKQRMGKLYVGTVVGLMVICLLAFKYIIHIFEWDFITLNPLVGTVVASATFITGFLLSGVFADYKEVDKIPSEIRSAMESIWAEAKALSRKDATFDLNPLRSILTKFVEEFEDGLSDTKNHSHMGCALDAIGELDQVFDDMEAREVPANYMTRIKSEQTNLRRLVLRVYHIQKTKFVPSVTVLVESAVFSVIGMILFVETDFYTGLIEVGLLSYLLLYTVHLIHILEKPFRKGKDDTADDVSIFLLREFSSEINK